MPLSILIAHGGACIPDAAFRVPGHFDDPKCERVPDGLSLNRGVINLATVPLSPSAPALSLLRRQLLAFRLSGATCTTQLARD